MPQTSFYPIGQPGQPWGAAERASWLARQQRQRSYADDVLARLDKLPAPAELLRYGEIQYGEERFPLYAVRTRDWHDPLPCALVTGGVHGYETSGVDGALRFAEHHLGDYAGRLNLLVAPCISPWAYERIQRWNAGAIDPNRSFRSDSPAAESAALWQLVQPLRGRFLLHIDLHETTDSDESEFRPALAARDGQPFEAGEIPDGFYLVDDEDNPQPGFQAAILAAVAGITHIAAADAQGQIIGSPIAAPGVIRYPFARLGLCAGISGARYTTTTEVYPDSPRATPEQCTAAQLAAIRAALDYALEPGSSE